MSEFIAEEHLLASLHRHSKACTIVLMNAEILHTLLIIFFVAIFLVSISYLQQRKMSCWAYAFWGTFALLLPAFGPFFVIAYRPGKSISRRRSKQKSGPKRTHIFRR